MPAVAFRVFQVFLVFILQETQSINEIHRAAGFSCNEVAILGGTVTASNPAAQSLFLFRSSIRELFQIRSSRGWKAAACSCAHPLTAVGPCKGLVNAGLTESVVFTGEEDEFHMLDQPANQRGGHPFVVQDVYPL